MAIIYHIPDFSVCLLNGYDFSFDHMTKTENTMNRTKDSVSISM